jgi:WD40 repeat protein
VASFALAVWTLKKRRRRRQKSSLEGYAESAAFSPDGQYLAVGDRNGQVSLWNPKTGQREAVLATE